MQQIFSFVHSARIYISLLIAFTTIYFWKLSGLLWIPNFSEHLSNFALTGIGLLLVIGPKGLYKKEGQRRIFAAVLFFAIANILVEVINIGKLGGFNTLDVMDAIFGVSAGIIIFLLYKYNTHKMLRYA